jgi:hypothetical protein
MSRGGETPASEPVDAIMFNRAAKMDGVAWLRQSGNIRKVIRDD